MLSFVSLVHVSQYHFLKNTRKHWGGRVGKNECP
jgi:hypothetical protein